MDTCCSKEEAKTDRGFLKGIFYGILPHSFCIGFILFSVLGAAWGTAIFKKFLIIPYFFQVLVAISFLMATISAVIYLKRNNCLCGQGIKRRWKYLTVLYGVTIFTNVFIFFHVFPAMANINPQNFNVTGKQLASLSLKVEIPCTGHALLITDELKKDNGVKNVQFSAPNTFNVQYDKNQTSAEKIESMEIFKTYKAIIN